METEVVLMVLGEGGSWGFAHEEGGCPGVSIIGVSRDYRAQRPDLIHDFLK